MTLGLMSLLFEAAVSILLIAVIVFAVKLNRRILTLRTQESELKEMIAQFNDAAMQAEASAGHLKSAGKDSERNLRATIERAQAMRDDLSFMIERGGKMSDRVDRSVERSREPSPIEQTINPSEPAAEEFDDQKIERNAERAVEAMVDRFASQAEPSLWLAAAKGSPDSGNDINPRDDKGAAFDREHWFDDDPGPSSSSDGSSVDPIAIAGPRVSTWTPGAGSTATEISGEDAEDSSRSEAERQMLKTLRTSGARR